MRKKFTISIALTIGIIYLIYAFNKAGYKRMRHVFIDLGANNGDSIKYFINTNSDYNENKEFLKGYGAKNDTKWDIYAVEANPFFNNSLDELGEYCKFLGHNYFLYKQSAAWIKNEKLKFYLDTVNPGYNYWGSSLLEHHPDVIRSNKTEILVQAIDVADLLKRYEKRDEIVLKIDVEGAEYRILMNLIQKNVLQLVDIIAVEYHNNLEAEHSRLLNEFNSY